MKQLKNTILAKNGNFLEKNKLKNSKKIKISKKVIFQN